MERLPGKAPDVENLDLLDRQSPLRTGAVGFGGALLVFVLEYVALLGGSATLFYATAFVLRLALPMLLVYFFSGCRCGDGPFYLTTGGLMGAVGALIGAGIALVLQSVMLGPNAGLGTYILTMGIYVFMTGLGAAALSGRYHSQSREIVWGDAYGAEVGRTAVEKFLSRARPAAPSPAPKAKIAKKSK